MTIPGPRTCSMPSAILLRVLHGDPLRDEDAWLREPADPRVVQFLELERDRERGALGHSRRIAEEFTTYVRRHSVDQVPHEFVVHGGRYRWRGSLLEGRPDGGRGRWRTVLDTEVYGVRAGGGGVTGISISPDSRFLALTLHRAGDEAWMARVRSLERGRDIGVVGDRVGPVVAWLGTERLLVSGVDDRGRPVSLHEFHLRDGLGPALLTVENPSTWLGILALDDGEHAIVESDEAWIAGLENDRVSLTPLRPPVDHDVRSAHLCAADAALVLQTIDADAGEWLLQTPMPPSNPPPWTVLYRAAEDETIDGLTMHDDCCVVLVRRAGTPTLRVLERDGRTRHEIGLGDLGVADSVGLFPQAVPPTVRSTHMTVAGPIDPGRELEVDVETGALEPVRMRTGPTGWRIDALTSRVEWVTAPDGVEVPMTIVHARDAQLPAPTILYGYGAYGVSTRATPSASAMFYLSRGWILATAHVRGGGELGPAWHRAAKAQHKHRSISDFVACARSLVENGLAEPSRLAASGGSAGGLLVCAAATSAPEMFGAIIARHPVTDVVEFLCDPGGRLSDTARLEFGEVAHDEDIARAVKAYNPFDNVRSAPYPAFFLVTGLQDQRVPWWQAARFARRVRAGSTSDAPILLHIGPIAGHTGGWGRGAYGPEAWIAAFLVAQFQRSPTSVRRADPRSPDASG